MTDPLLDGETGVYSRAAWDRLADAEISRARRYGDPLTLALIKLQPSDMESPENFRETFGKLAKHLSERCRHEDIVGRFSEDVLSILAVTLNGDSNVLVGAFEEACDGFNVVVVGASHQLTRPFAATLREAEAALTAANRKG